MSPYDTPFQACRANLCEQGRRICPTPQACQAPERELAPASAAELLPWLTLRRFWIGYALGIVSGVVGLHMWARLA